ncbi:PAS domain-containing protein [Methylobacterium sp. sgz302541]|uniref:PAS domain-containing protein n=1 Tax=unclassified Methylobacterium TaxID=2615210 RepID=UPI003D3468CE
MKHPTSRLLHGYWDRLRGERAAPERAEIEPGEIRGLLADSLVLEVDMPTRSARLRLAGTRVCALFGRELKGTPFADLWGGADRGGTPGPWRLVEIVGEDTAGVVAGIRATTERGESLDLELLLLPLRHQGRTQERMLGSLSPAGIPPWLGLRPVTGLVTTSLRVLGPTRERAAPDAAASLRDLPLPANDSLPLRRGHLLVHRGGRA